MVFIGGWRSRRRRYRRGEGPRNKYDPRYDPEPRYGNGGRYRYAPRYRRGFGGGGGGSCMRDVFMLEGGCCLAEMLGCGPQLLLVRPSAWSRLRTAAAPAAPSNHTAPIKERLRTRLIIAIQTYQAEISTRRRACCRYSPTCSHYAVQSLQVHGLRRGVWLTLHRLARCHPGAAGGLDPVRTPARHRATR